MDEDTRVTQWRHWSVCDYDQILDLLLDYFDCFEQAVEWWQVYGKCDMNELVGGISGFTEDVAFGTALASRYHVSWPAAQQHEEVCQLLQSAKQLARAKVVRRRSDHALEQRVAKHMRLLTVHG